ncbi:MAG: tail protein X [Enterovibrio sp.]
MKQFVVRSVEGDTIDAICYRYFGRTGSITEQVLEINPHIADAGPALPVNTTVRLPVTTVAVRTSVTTLWD